ncbi:hypothetical protein RHGRI_034180 [Rhododendron griersonianum]|uniref:Uncharacterized protein n=1 Tax=Rhododendron griersonianum TaxID=479676 RepID=A0AAV6HZI2_9ERIC|nr:hypothetical protein RHGRI_034180 [Rhododendron griersonianum]
MSSWHELSSMIRNYGSWCSWTSPIPNERLLVGRSFLEKLPQYPLPTHNVVLTGKGGSIEFEGNVVAYKEAQRVELEKKLFIKDAISDLPPVKKDEARDEMPYHSEAMTEFQQFIRLRKDDEFA